MEINTLISEVLAVSGIEYIVSAIAGVVGALGLYGFGGSKKSKKISYSSKETFKTNDQESDAAKVKDISSDLPQEKKSPVGVSWWGALSKTRNRFTLKFNGEIQDLKDSLEEACITSDLGVGNTQDALDSVDWAHAAKLSGDQRGDWTRDCLKNVISPWVTDSKGDRPEEWPISLKEKIKGPVVIWFVGVNGVGKTTSIAKLASELKNKGNSVLLACGDTFRAAATEQLEVWAKRLGIEAVRGNVGADSSSVLFDAITSAKAKGIDFVLCDSAGRLNNNIQLMEALQKNKRVMNKALDGSPHEVVLVLDANTGQNMIQQCDQFLESVGVTGLVLSKLDGSARGGAVVAVARKTKLPIRRLGLGESVEDFTYFQPEKFTEALLGIQ